MISYFDIIKEQVLKNFIFMGVLDVSKEEDINNFRTLRINMKTISKNKWNTCDNHWLIRFWYPSLVESFQNFFDEISSINAFQFQDRLDQNYREYLIDSILSD